MFANAFKYVTYYGLAYDKVSIVLTTQGITPYTPPTLLT